MFKVRGLILSFICVLSLPGFVSGAKQQPSAGLSRQMKRLHEYERLQRVLEESNPKLCEQFVLLSEKVMARAKLAAQDKKAIQAFLKKVASDQNVNQRDKKSITQFLRPGLSTGAQVGIGVGSAAAVVAALAGLAIAARKGVSLGIKSALSGFTPLPTGGASLVGAGAAADRGTGAGAGLGEDGPVGADGLPVMPVLPSSIAVEQRSGDPAAALVSGAGRMSATGDRVSPVIGATPGVDIGAAVVGVHAGAADEHRLAGDGGLPVMPVLPSSIAVEQRSGDPAAALGVDIGTAVVGVPAGAADEGRLARAGLGEDGPAGAGGPSVMSELPSSIAVEQRSGDPAAALGMDIGAAVDGVHAGAADEGRLAGAGLGAEVVALDKRQRFIKMLLEFRRELQKLTINPTQINQPDPYNPGEVISDFYREMAVCLGGYTGTFKSLKDQVFEDYLKSCGYKVESMVGARGGVGNLALICQKGPAVVCIKVVRTPETSTLMAHRIAKLLPIVYSEYRRRIVTKARETGEAEENNFIHVEPAYSYLVKLNCGKYVQLQERVVALSNQYRFGRLSKILTPDVIDQLILVESLIGTYDMHANNVGLVSLPDGTQVIKLFDLERIGYPCRSSDQKRVPSAKEYFISTILSQYKKTYNSSHIDEIQKQYQRAEKD